MLLIRTVLSLSLLISAASALPFASADDDTLVRLPGQGELRDRQNRERLNLDRLKPGGGLFISFDTDANGEVSPAEIDAGIPVAFTDADANEDGVLTAIEQQAWAGRLPTRDDSLANPVRFDPNLDRRVSLEEFTSVIQELGLDYADETSGLIQVADLKAPKKEPTRREQEILDRRAELERARTRPVGSVGTN